MSGHSDAFLHESRFHGAITRRTSARVPTNAIPFPATTDGVQMAGVLLEEGVRYGRVKLEARTSDTAQSDQTRQRGPRGIISCRYLLCNDRNQPTKTTTNLPDCGQRIIFFNQIAELINHNLHKPPRPQMKITNHSYIAPPIVPIGTT